MRVRELNPCVRRATAMHSIIELLVQSNADVSVHDESRITALHLAAHGRMIDTVQLLIKVRSAWKSR
jgi:ankyrin repeat protein